MDTLIIFNAKYLIYILIVIAAVYIFIQDKQRRRNILIFTMITLPLSYVVAKIASLLYYDPLPFVTENFMPLIPQDAGNGFPSDHTLLSGAIAAAIFPFSKKTGAFFFILAIIIGFSRVLAGVHHTVDIIGSLFIVSLVSYLIYRFVFPRQKKLIDTF